VLMRPKSARCEIRAVRSSLRRQLPDAPVGPHCILSSSAVRPSARWLSTCGKLPARCRALTLYSSDKSPRSLLAESTRSKVRLAASHLPCNCWQSASQQGHARKTPSGTASCGFQRWTKPSSISPFSIAAIVRAIRSSFDRQKSHEWKQQQARIQCLPAITLGKSTQLPVVPFPANLVVHLSSEPLHSRIVLALGFSYGHFERDISVDRHPGGDLGIDVMPRLCPATPKGPDLAISTRSRRGGRSLGSRPAPQR
jgi:hypothetical protein